MEFGLSPTTLSLRKKKKSYTSYSSLSETESEKENLKPLQAVMELDSV